MAKHAGFSLVELAIVLVIVGLIVGGVIAGQSLIRASEIRSIVRDYQRYHAATYAFRDKYLGLPGDLTRAEDFWGTAALGADCKSTDSTTLSDTKRTCNGDGNGLISHTPSNSNEHFRFWQHLANAGLIEGSFTGIAGPLGSRDAEVGWNVPASRISRVGYSIEAKSAVDETNTFYWSSATTNVMFAGIGSIAGHNTESAFLKPEEAWNIDTKIDDGKPGIGTIRTMKNHTSCRTTDVAQTSEYQVDRNQIVCSTLWYQFI